MKRKVKIATVVAVLLVAGVMLAVFVPDSTPFVEVPEWAHVAPEQIAEAKKHGVPVAFENDMGMRFVLVPSGTFMMGSPEDEEGRRDHEFRREVTIPKPFYMQITEVTNEQYEVYRPKHESGVYCGHWLDWPAMPVVNVPFHDAADFATWLGTRGEGRVYRLPGESEWERACRAGSQTRFWWSDSTRQGHSCANAWDPEAMLEFDDSREGWPRSDGHVAAANVGSFLSNPWGLYDMSGNASEWCREEPRQDAVRAVRGGSWYDAPAEQRCAARSGLFPRDRMWYVGFRLVSPLPAERQGDNE